ncbi:magnesium/cobalt transporter CorA [Salimicrobium halophilum]|uniref:Magnesium transport protein CorA n=1 Tax=Salimicrobium halophilum TaxID=86666 RepID=A0A1G8RM81_9BACI|nr:magnesium/cobalt transporter CorA [Salimicrobium halophilum]SDJ18081.1 magnesium transporter [Salimicrobium halophilum]
MIHSMAFHRERGMETMEHLTDIWKNDYEWRWIDFDNPSSDEKELLEKEFSFHPLAVEDCFHKLQRPKLDDYGDHTFFVLHTLDRQTLEKEEIDVFLSEGLIVTFHKHSSSFVKKVRDYVVKKPSSADEAVILHNILDQVVDAYFPIIYSLEDQINDLEDNTNELSMEDMLEELFDRRGELLKMRQTVHSMRDMVYRMLYTHDLENVYEHKEYFRDIYDHLLKVSDMIASNREMTQDIRDSHLSMTSHRQNKTMQFLTVVSMIFLPLTFIAGVYGMNFAYMPELDYKYSYFIIWGIMIMMTVAMVVFFKKKGWFD